MESPEEFYREFDKLRLRVGDLGYTLIKLIEAYHRAGTPFGETGEALRIWVRHRQWTTLN